MTDPSPAPFSAKFDLSRLGDTPSRITIRADEAACAAIAAGFGLPAIASLAGDYVITSGDGPAARTTATLTLTASVTQICVVSLETFEQSITERASLILLTEAEAAALDLDHTIIDPDAPDEIIAHGTMVDLGIALTEQLALALDPYPRKPGIPSPDDSGPADSGPVEATSPRPSPFAALAALAAKRPDPEPN